MAQQDSKQVFAKAGAPVLSMPEALARAREALTLINPCPVDSVRSCTRTEDGGWRAVLDVIESPARMGDNDLLSAYELTLGPTGDLIDFQRTERFHREDRIGG